MRKITTYITALVFSVLMFSCAKENVDEELKSVDYVSESSVNYNYSEIESEILSEVNKYRLEKGLSELEEIGEISIEAEDHNYYMVDVGKVSHDNFGKRYEALVNGIGARAVSENVAFGYRTADAVVKAWLNSEGHRENIEKDFTHFGISVVQNEEGRNYFTNIFVRR